MPVVDQEEEISDVACKCCGFKTVFSSGFVVLDQGDHTQGEMEYVARWTDGKSDHNVFFLVYLEAKERYVSAVFSFADNAFGVVEPEDSDWGDVEQSELVARSEIFDTEHWSIILQALREIFEHDKALVKFAEISALEKIAE